jgi:FtsZ-interacting cell division protein ZipA
MAKEKLFTPEDFDKPTDKDNKWVKKLLIGIVGLIIVGLIVWGIKAMTTQSSTSDSTQTASRTDYAKTEAANNAQENGDITTETQQVVTNEQPTPAEDTEDISADSSAPQTPNISTAQVQNSSVSDDIEKEAQRVIRGDYGNVPQRKELLGSKYQQIQNRVNQLKKEGAF